MTAQQFEYDVFLSHASADKAEVRELAQRLKGDGLRVWLDEWVIQPGDLVSLAIEKGLERSRTLVLVMSQAAFDSEWVTLERHTALFRDPTNQQRRFIPLRLDDTEIPESLKLFAYVDWYEKGSDQYKRLLKACDAAPLPLQSDKKDNDEGAIGLRLQYRVGRRIVIAPNGQRAAVGTYVYDLGDSDIQNIQGFPSSPVPTAMTADGDRLIRGMTDGTVEVWNANDSTRIAKMKEDAAIVSQVAVDARGAVALSGSTYGALYVWNLETLACEANLNYHQHPLSAIALTRDGMEAVSLDASGHLAVWNVRSKALVGEARLPNFVPVEAPFPEYLKRANRLVVAAASSRLVIHGIRTTLHVYQWFPGDTLREFVLEGHTDEVRCVAVTDDGRWAVSGSEDRTIRIWNLVTRGCVSTIQTERPIIAVDVSDDAGRIAALLDDYHSLSTWQLSREVLARSADYQDYTNAKVLLVGDSGVGKTGLAIRLTANKFEPTVSTDAHWATQLRIPNDTNTNVIDREIWQWDFAGQADYRLIHQLFMDETAAVVLVFNPQSENPFEGIGQWDRDLHLAARRSFAKLLVAGRCDRGGIAVSRESIEKFADERGYEQFLQSSAKTGEGCAALRDAIEHCIDWDSIPWTASPRIFKLLKEEIIRLGDEGFTLLRMSELKQQLEMRLPDDAFTYEELKAVVGLLAGPGHVWQLEFGQFVLLHPERINSYAAAVGRTVRSHLQQIGVIHESAMLAGQLNFGDIQRLSAREEAIVLRAMHQTLVDHGFCLTQETDAGPLLVFPSYFNRERRDQIDHPRIFGTFRFSGALEELYATLVVKLHHTLAFETEELWRYAADFVADGGKVGVKMNKLGEGDAEIITYCDPDVAIESKVIFIQYIHEHLKRYDSKVTLVRHYVCPNDECGEALSDVKAILRARERGRTHLTCQYCDESIPLWDELEQELASEKYEARVREMEATSRAGIDRESRDLMLEYHAFAIAEETSQRYVPVEDADFGVQARIDLTDFEGKPSGRCLQLQLRPSEVYKSVKTNRDGTTVFQVGPKKLVEQWLQSESPVMLIHRTDDGFIRWMDVSTWLKGKSARRKTPINQIVFEGEPFTALSLQRMRDKMFAP